MGRKKSKRRRREGGRVDERGKVEGEREETTTNASPSSMSRYLQISFAKGRLEFPLNILRAVPLRIILINVWFFLEQTY